MSLLSPVLHLFGRIRCLYVPHEPKRRRVHKKIDGHHLSYCNSCGVRIRRKGHNDWAPYNWNETDRAENAADS